MTNNDYSYRPEIDQVASQSQNGKMPLDSTDEAGNLVLLYALALSRVEFHWLESSRHGSWYVCGYVCVCVCIDARGTNIHSWKLKAV